MRALRCVPAMLVVSVVLWVPASSRSFMEQGYLFRARKRLSLTLRARKSCYRTVEIKDQVILKKRLKSD